jgi:hypothetical protein
MPTLDQSATVEIEDIRTKRSRYFDRHREPFSSNRKCMMLPLPGILECNAVYPGQKTRAPSPCWRDSTSKPVKWQHMTPDAAKELYRQAEDFERQTRKHGRQDGALGRNGLAVLRALIFAFLNYTTGQLDPGYESIARKACISVRSAARGLASLKRAGVLNWLRRCTPIIEAGRCILEQITNAYALIPASQWLGYRPSPKRSTPPKPEPGTWGDPPALPDALTAAIIERREGGTGRGILRELESDPRDVLANALASLGRALGIAETPQIPDMPA